MLTVASSRNLKKIENIKSLTVDENDIKESNIKSNKGKFFKFPKLEQDRM